MATTLIFTVPTMQESYEYHSVTLSVKIRHAGDQFAKKTWQKAESEVDSMQNVAWNHLKWKKGWSRFLYNSQFVYNSLWNTQKLTTSQTILTSFLYTFNGERKEPPMNPTSKRVSTATEKVPQPRHDLSWWAIKKTPGSRRCRSPLPLVLVLLVGGFSPPIWKKWVKMVSSSPIVVKIQKMFELPPPSLSWTRKLIHRTWEWLAG